jgi:TIR domain
MSRDVFISHSHHDKTAADAACAVLEAHGLCCWIAPRDVAPGANWIESIMTALGEVRCMVLVFSNHANGSKQVQRELERAAHREIPIVPLRIEAASPSRVFEYLTSSGVRGRSPPRSSSIPKSRITAKTRRIRRTPYLFATFGPSR